MKVRIACILLLGVLLAGFNGCSMFRFGSGAPDALPASIEVEGSNYEDKLHELIAESLASDQQADSPSSAAMKFRKPYYFREYVAYPDGIAEYTSEIRASESRTTPYSAQIRLNKNRYVTKFNKKQGTARNDDTFYESTGYETRAYELRNGRWREIGTLYVAETTDPRLKTSAAQTRFGDPAETPDLEGNRGWRKILFWRE